MCGIVGCISKDTEINHLWIESMNDVQKHRGPDAKGVFLDSNVGLGHTRLSILDLSAAGNQPMFSKCKRYVIIFNGEVYNYKEIAKYLAISTISNSDTEVLVEAYAKIGSKAISLFNGMFTLAIYDKVEKSLFLARDRMGVKPLFYSFTNNILAFSSELKSILKLPFVSKEINTSCFSSYLHVGYIPEPETIYKNIFKFPASNFAEFKNGALTFTNYWNIEEKIDPVSFTNEKEVKKELKNLIESSIQYRLISDVPVGAFLSGGVDSSLITAVANKFYSSKIKTFSIGFEDSKFNEAPFAKKVANHIGTEHHEFILSEKTAIDSFVKLNSIYDEPFADTSAIPTLMVSEMASKSVKIVLSGDGGDELFLGYGAHAWANRLKKPLLDSLKNPISQVCKFGSDRFKRIGHLFERTKNDNLYTHIFSQEQYFFHQTELKALFCNPLDNHFNPELEKLNRILSPTEEQGLLDMKHYLKDDLLVKVDRASMYHSIELREPLLDYRLVEFALNIAPSLKIKDNQAKYILKQVLYDYLPESLFERPKWGFSIPMARWLKHDIRYIIEENLSKSVIESFGIVHYHKVKELIDAFDAGRDYYYNRIWVLASLHAWLRENS